MDLRTRGNRTFIWLASYVWDPRDVVYSLNERAFGQVI